MSPVLVSLFDPPIASPAGRALPASSAGGADDENLIQLKAIFIQLKEHDIKLSLKKANGDFQKAVDDLLNIQLLDEEGLRMKGIDAFFRPDDEVSSKKRKGKKKARGNISDNQQGAELTAENISARGEFLCVRRHQTSIHC
jgi:hypothetical protein